MPSDQASVLPGPLIDRYVRHLADLHVDVMAMEEQLLGQTANNSDILERMRGVAHRLAGTAEGYGFADLGVSARALEHAICADRTAVLNITSHLAVFLQRLGGAALRDIG